jgi:RNA polymerase sigma factor for flagellar operon FliA
MKATGLRPQATGRQATRRGATHLPPDEAALWHAYRRNPAAARNRLVERYWPLVKHLAAAIWQRLPDTVELDDLEQAGVFGLVDAIERYDIGRGLKFATYATPRIRGAILDHLRAGDWAPRLVRQKAKQLAGAIDSAERQLGRQPTLRELARLTRRTPREIERLVEEVRVPTLESLSKPIGSNFYERPLQMDDLLPDPRGQQPDTAALARDVWRAALAGCNRAERLLLILYYHEQLTMKQIGRSLGLSESRISQLHSALVERLRTRLADRRCELFAAARA